MRFFKTTGDKGQDKQWDYTEHRLARLEALQTGSTSQVASTQSVVTSVASGLTVQQSDGSNSQVATILQVDLTAGFSVTNNEPVATISRTANTIAPPAIASAAAAGASIIAANEDHTHAGVTSFNGSQGAVTGVASIAVAGNLIAESGSTGAVTLTVKVPMVTSDPGSPAAGDLWFRTDTGNLSIYTGAATKRVAMV